MCIDTPTPSQYVTVCDIRGVYTPENLYDLHKLKAYVQGFSAKRFCEIMHDNADCNLEVIECTCIFV